MVTDFILARQKTHFAQADPDTNPPENNNNATPYEKTIQVVDYTNLVDTTSTLSVGSKVYTFVSGAPTGDQIQISTIDNDDQADKINTKINTDLVPGELDSSTVTTDTVTLTGLPDGSDFVLATNQSNALTLVTTQTGSPKKNQIIENTDARRAILVATLLWNVDLDAGATATVQIWIWDALLNKWCRAEKVDFPPTGSDNSYPHALKSDIAGQTCGITVPALAGGKITITGALTARSIGGS